MPPSPNWARSRWFERDWGHAGSVPVKPQPLTPRPGLWSPLSAHLGGLSGPPALVMFGAEDLGGIEPSEELLEMPTAIDLGAVDVLLFRGEAVVDPFALEAGAPLDAGPMQLTRVSVASTAGAAAA